MRPLFPLIRKEGTFKLVEVLIVQKSELTPAFWIKTGDFHARCRIFPAH